jgi:asparagine synthase (glutamine-hydrolysing)
LGEKAIDRFSIFTSSIENKGECYLSIISIFHRDELEELCTTSLLQEGRDPKIDETINHHLESADSKRLLYQLQLMEIETELPDDLLMKVDKMTQANSVEARVPYLDHRLVEFSSSIPENLKLRGLTDKYVLRKAMSKFLPRGIGGRKKHRFFVPIDSWIENNREMVSQILSEENIRKRGYFKSKYIRQMMRHFQRSKLYFSRQLWSLLTLELWHQIFLDSDDLYDPSLPQLV